MGLKRGNLGVTTQVATGSSFAAYVVGSAQTAYIKGILMHNTNTTSGANVKIHVVPNNSGLIGNGNSTTTIGFIGIATAETYFFEPSYPITLSDNGDSLQIENLAGINGAINVLLLGDKEA